MKTVNKKEFITALLFSNNRVTLSARDKMGGKSSKSVRADPAPSDDKINLFVNMASPLARAVLCTADELGIDYNSIVRNPYQL